MPDGQKGFWLPAVATAVATLVIAAGAAYAIVSWAVPKTQHYLDDRFAAVDAKIEMSNRSALSALTGLPSLAKTAQEIETLNAKIKKTNDTLDAIQKQISLTTMKAELAPLDGKLDKANTVLAAIQSELTRAKPDVATGNAALARIEKTVNTVKDEIAGAASAAKLQDAATKLDNANAALAKLQDAAAKLEDVRAALAKLQATVTKLDDVSAAVAKLQATATKLDDVSAQVAKLQATAAKSDVLEKSLGEFTKAADMLKTSVAANASALAETHKSLAALDTAVKDGFSAATSSRSALKEEVAKLTQPGEPATTGATNKASEDLLVLYVATQAPAQQVEPSRGATIPPMSVHFEKVGSTNDEGQTALIIRKLRPIFKKHHGCSIAVSGHADTLGNDDLNHKISKRRAQKVVTKLKSAFGGRVRITEAAWGERMLKEWTDDETPDVTNRRVDIVVRCAG